MYFLLIMLNKPPLSSMIPMIWIGVNVMNSSTPIISSSCFLFSFLKCFLYFYFKTSYIISFESLNLLIFGNVNYLLSSLNSMDPAKPYRFDFFSCFFSFSRNTEKHDSINDRSWAALSILLSNCNSSRILYYFKEFFGNFMLLLVMSFLS